MQPTRRLNFIQLTQDLFVVWVLVGAWWGYQYPAAAGAQKGWIAEALMVIMLGMGLTLRTDDIRGVGTQKRAVAIGVLLQFAVMPLAAWGLAKLLGLPPELAVGMILVGACPGGTASNVVAFLARGDVALSVAMTSISTLLAPLLTPAWVLLLASTWIPVEMGALFLSVAKIVLLPVAIGIAIRAVWTPPKCVLEGLLPLVSMAVIAWIVGVIVGLNQDQLFALPLVLVAVIAHNAIGLFSGYRLTPSTLGRSAKRAVAIEVGMQNSGLAVALAVAHFGPMAAVPGALFSVWHNVSGPVMASIWRRSDLADRAESN